MDNQVIGETAGKVWQFLNSAKKEVPLSVLVDKVKAPRETIHQAIGWLAREDKLNFRKEGKINYISLKEYLNP